MRYYMECEECGRLITYEEYEDNYGICDECNYEDYLLWLLGY